MNSKMAIDDSNIYKKDIEDIFDFVGLYIPNLENWYFDQSIIFEDNKKIIFKAITSNNKKIGNQISIVNIGDNVFNYDLVLLEDSVSLSKSYVKDKKFIKENMKIEIGDSYFERECHYFVEGEKYNYKERYNLKKNRNKVSSNCSFDDELCDMSLEEILRFIKKNVDKQDIVKRR